MQSKNRLKSERERVTNDFYRTPKPLCRAALTRLFDDDSLFINDALDPGCGTGVWGEALLDLYPTGGYVPNLLGIDIDPFPVNPAYASWLIDNYLTMKILTRFELVFGNPPYNLAEEFVRKSFKVLSDNGRIFFLLRLAFLESKKRYFGLFNELKPKRVYVLSRRPSFFSTNGRRTVDSLSYAMFLWQNNWKGKTELDWLYWDYSD